MGRLKLSHQVTLNTDKKAFTKEQLNQYLQDQKLLIRSRRSLPDSKAESLHKSNKKNLNLTEISINEITNIKPRTLLSTTPENIRYSLRNKGISNDSVLNVSSNSHREPNKTKSFVKIEHSSLSSVAFSLIGNKPSQPKKFKFELTSEREIMQRYKNSISNSPKKAVIKVKSENHESGSFTVPKPLDEQKLFLNAVKQTEKRHHLEEKSQNLTNFQLDGTSPLSVGFLSLGNYLIKTWCGSEFPGHLVSAEKRKITLCPFCLRIIRQNCSLLRHLSKCSMRSPPGILFYDSSDIRIYFVDGSVHSEYCRNLCLMAKLFISTKTLHQQVSLFDFFVLTTRNHSDQCHQLVGYFSRDKDWEIKQVMSCLLILPPYLKRGYGQLLIDLSYKVSLHYGLVGSPEHPLSDMGLLAFRKYWMRLFCVEVMNKLKTKHKSLSIKSLGLKYGVYPADIISTLQFMGLIRYYRLKHLILKNPKLFKKYAESKSNYVDVNHLRWKSLPPKPPDLPG